MTATTSGSLRRFAVAAVALGMTAGTIAVAGGAGAQAASLPRARAVGRFLDGSTGGAAIRTLADLSDARAAAPGTASARDPVDVTFGGRGTAPLARALTLPGGGVFTLGAADQLAGASLDGAAYGASGAIAAGGGTKLHESSGRYPAVARIDLSSAAVGSVPIPGLLNVPGIPGTTTDLAALSGISATIRGISALARTAVGGDAGVPKSSVADLELAIGSPALGALLAELNALTGSTVLDALAASITSTLPANFTLPTGFALPQACTFSPSVLKKIVLGGVMIDAARATTTVDVGTLVRVLLHKDISHLFTSDVDVTTFLAKRLPGLLTLGLRLVVSKSVESLTGAQFAPCRDAVDALTPSSLGLPHVPVAGGVTVADVITALTSNLRTGQRVLIAAIDEVAAQLTRAADGPLGGLAAALGQVVRIGLNVQHGPGIEAHDTRFPFTTALRATPDQASGVVAHQTIVRAIEIDLRDTSGLPTPGAASLPVPGSVRSSTVGPGTASRVTAASGARAASRVRAASAVPAAAAGTVAVLALGNAAAGPSTPAVATPTPSVSIAPIATFAPIVTIPTAIPAGSAGHGGGSPLTPIALVLLVLVAGTAGATTLRTRGRGLHGGG